MNVYLSWWYANCGARKATGGTRKFTSGFSATLVVKSIFLNKLNVDPNSALELKHDWAWHPHANLKLETSYLQLKLFSYKQRVS